MNFKISKRIKNGRAKNWYPPSWTVIQVSANSTKFSEMVDLIVVVNIWYSAIAKFRVKSSFKVIFKMAAILTGSRNWLNRKSFRNRVNCLKSIHKILIVCFKHVYVTLYCWILRINLNIGFSSKTGSNLHIRSAILFFLRNWVQPQYACDFLQKIFPLLN